MIERVYHRVLMALRSFLRRGTVEQELDEELQFHLDQMQEFSGSRRDDLSDARWRARRHMGSVDSVKEACRDMRTLRPVEHFLTDLRFGARLLVRGPGFTTVAVLSLALGIGSSSAIFSVIDAIVLRSLPIADPQELHIAQAMAPDEVEQFFSYPVVERAAELLAGRAQVAAQSSVESVLIATERGRGWSESSRGGAAATGGRRLLWHLAPACSDRSSARSRRQSNPRPTSRRGDERSVLEPPVWPVRTRAGYRADHQRRHR